MQRIQISIQDTGTAPTEFRLHGVEFVQVDPFARNPNGMVVVTADDSHVTHHSVLRPALSAHGWKATPMPVIDAHGTNGAIFMSTAQVQDLHGTYGR